MRTTSAKYPIAITAICLCSLFVLATARAGETPAPYYTPASIVNAASYSASALAPNTIASIYGTNLSFVTATAEGYNVLTAGLPTTLGGVTVYISSIAAGLYYVSPNQINFVVPADFQPVPVPLVILRESHAGPTVQISLNPAAPALFPDSNGDAIATHLNGALVNQSAPAGPGEWVVIYAEGLGPTDPAANRYSAAPTAAPIVLLPQFSILLDGNPVDAGALYYVGITPGFVGLYQINLHLPQNVAANPQVLVSIGNQSSQPNLQLAVD
jgi:uncharacterized protein (TIGR03437 family)